jgi:hypothetical protein
LEVKERRRDKERPKTSPKPKVDTSAPEEVAESENVVRLEETSAEETSSSDQLESIPIESTPEPISSEAPQVVLPRWGDLKQTEWMYHIPPREEDKKMWAEEWADFLINWAESRSLHVLSVATFVKEQPFNDMLGKVDAFRVIGDLLVEKDVGEWLDEKKKQLRVYWRPLEEWGDIMYKWAIRTGRLRLDVQSIVVQESKEEFAGLPERDLHRIMEIIVSKGMAKWVDTKKGAILVLV